MARIVKTCRVCGKQYEACRTVSKAVGVFRWQDVSCSPECGEIYLRRINESRGLVNTTAADVNAPDRSTASVDAVSEPVKHSKQNRKDQRPQFVEASGEASGDMQSEETDDIE